MRGGGRIHQRFLKNDEFELLKKGYITYSSQEKIVEKGTTYIKVITGVQEEKEYYIPQTMYQVKEIANDIFNRLCWFDQDAGTTYSKK